MAPVRIDLSCSRSIPKGPMAKLTKYERKHRRRQQQRERQKQKAVKNMPPSHPITPPQSVDASDEKNEGQDIACGANQQDGSKHPGASCPWWIAWLTNPGRRAVLIADVVFSGVIAAATCAQVYYGNRQWDATEKQWQAMLESNKSAQLAAEAASNSNKIAAATASQQLRAYVDLVTESTIELYYSEETKNAGIQMQFRNNGQTPARKIEVRLSIGYHETEDPPPLTSDMLILTKARQTLGPGQQMGIVFARLIEPDKKHIVDKMGPFFIRVFGRLDYIDAFGEKRWTEFILRQGPEIKTGTYAAYIEHQDSN